MARKLTINPTIPIEVQRSLKQLASWSQADEGHINDLKAATGLSTAAPTASSGSAAAGPQSSAQQQSIVGLLSSKISTLVNFRGNWSATVAYVPNDMVVYSSGAYLCLVGTTGTPTSNTTYWFKFGGGGGGGGSVTSVGLSMPTEFTVAGSPVTTAGTLTVSKANESANKVWAGPSSGSAAVPTFRSLVSADLPSGVGSVTSVAMTVPAEFSVAGSPITTNGTLAITKATESANEVWAGPTSGAAAQPAFRALVPADLPIATTSALGAVQPDGTTITISGGIISAASSGGVTILGSANWTISGGSITGATYKGVVTNVTRNASGRYTATMSGITGTNYNVLFMTSIASSAYNICNIDTTGPTFSNTTFSWQSVNQAGNAFLDPSPCGFIITQ